MTLGLDDHMPLLAMQHRSDHWHEPMLYQQFLGSGCSDGPVNVA